MPRLKPLAGIGLEIVLRRLDYMAEQAYDVANTIGPAYGAPWCDKGLKLARAIEKLRREIEDKG